MPPWPKFSAKKTCTSPMRDKFSKSRPIRKFSAGRRIYRGCCSSFSLASHWFLSGPIQIWALLIQSFFNFFSSPAHSFNHFLSFSYSRLFHLFTVEVFLSFIAKVQCGFDTLLKISFKFVKKIHVCNKLTFEEKKTSFRFFYQF